MQRISIFALALCLLAGAGTAHAAGGNVVYIHGSRMTSWPSAAKLKSSSAWTHRTLSFNGSARLQNSTVKTAVKNALDSYCKTTDCVIACYSAGCNRLLLALYENSATTYRILWTEALASAAGGTENAKYSTNKGLRLLAKAFLADVPPSAAVDNDLTPEVMRNTYGHIQNGARAPMYHLAGKKNICLRLNAWGLIAATAYYTWQGLRVGGPITWISVVANVIMGFFKAKSKKFCGNSKLPGKYGDGVVPVHSAAGYADKLAHASHHDGGPKYTWRAYEQVALFDNDHRGLFTPFVAKGSLRLAVNATATCPNMAAEPAYDEASIVFEDADGAVHQQSQTDHLLMICGASALSDPVLYGTCVGVGNCCDNFEEGQTSGCTCGESLCTQSGGEYYSYYTQYDCAGFEYGEVQYAGSVGRSWDGGGMVGLTTQSVTVRSRRSADGTCKNATYKRTYGTASMCPDFWRDQLTSATARRIYRAGFDPNMLPDPAGGDDNYNGWITHTINQAQSQCP